MITVLPFVLAAMAVLVPDRDHTEIGEAIAFAVDSEPALFAGDVDRRKTAALVVAISYRESSFNNEAVSRTNDWCHMQINRRPELASDAEECTRVGLTMLRESFRMCPASPVAFYAAGPGACTNARALRISRDRMNLAKWLVARIKVEL